MNQSKSCLKCSTYLDIDNHKFYDEIKLKEILWQCFSLDSDRNSKLFQTLCTTCLDDFVKLYDILKKLKSDDELFETLPSLTNNENVRQKLSIENSSFQSLSSTELNLVEVKHNKSEESDTENEHQEFNKMNSDFSDGYINELHEEYLISEEENENEKFSNIINDYKIQTVTAFYENICFEEDILCKICHEKLNTHRMLIEHVEEYHAEIEKYPCIIDLQCKPEKTQKKLSNHLIFDHYSSNLNILELQCPYCRQTFNNFLNLNKHSCCNEIPRKKSTTVCSKCKLNFSNLERYRFHQQFCKLIKHRPKACLICNTEYTNESLLFDHVMNQHGDPSNENSSNANCDNRTCLQCKINFNCEADLLLHMSVIHRVGDYSCQVCNKNFKLESKLKKHDNNYHVPEKCTDCEEILENTLIFKIHYKEIHKNRSVKCTDCDKILKNKKNFDVHYKMVHKGEKRFFCTYCKKGYFNSSDCIKHEETKHKKSILYKCDICPYSTQFKESIEVHKKKHENIREFVCEICNKAFLRKYTLELHKRRHNKIRGFVCPYDNCSSSYPTQGHLNSHIRTKHSDGNKKNTRYIRKRKNLAEKLESDLQIKKNINIVTSEIIEETYHDHIDSEIEFVLENS